jgi:hypothetical protein
MYKRIRPLFAPAKRHRWLQYNPIDDLIAPETPSAKREVYTPEQYKKPLKAAFSADDGEDLWLYLFLSGNAFFRSQELVRRFGGEPVLDWSHFLWDRSLIHVRAEVAKSTKRKSGNERFVPLHQNIYDWLKLFRSNTPSEGRVITHSVRYFRKQLSQLHTTADVPFIDNGMRKSAISYYLAANPDVGVVQVSNWAGNSEASCRQHYLKVLTQEQGDEWFDAPKKAYWERFREQQEPEIKLQAALAALETEKEERAMVLDELLGREQEAKQAKIREKTGGELF